MRVFMLVCLLVLVSLGAVNAQEGETPFLPENRQVITPENVLEMEPIGQIGSGLLFGARLLADGTLALATTYGVYLYADGDLNGVPRVIAYDPNPYAARYAVVYQANVRIDGSTITVSNGDGTVAVDTITGTTRLLDSAERPGDGVLSPDGIIEAALSQNGVTILDAVSGAALTELPLNDRVRRLIFSPSGDRLLAVQEEQTAIYDTATFELIETLPLAIVGMTEDAYIVLEETERSLADIVLLALTTLEERTRIADAMCETRVGSSVLYDAETQTLYALHSGRAPGSVRAWDLSVDPPQLMGEALNFRTAITQVAFSEDGSSLYVVYNSGLPLCNGAVLGEGVVRYDMTTGRPVERLPFDPQTLVPVSVGVNADDDVIVGGWRSAGLLIDGNVQQAQFEGGFMTSVSLTNDNIPYGVIGTQLVRLTPEGEIMETLAQGIQGNAGTPGWGTAVIAQDNLLFYISGENTVIIQDLTTGETRHTLNFKRVVNSLDYDPISGVLAVHIGFGFVEGVLNEVQFFQVGEDIVALIAIADVNTAMHVMDLAPGGDLLAVTNIGGDLSRESLDMGETWAHFYDARSGERIGGFFDPYVQYPLAFSPDGTLMLIAGGPANLQIYGIPGE